MLLLSLLALSGCPDLESMRSPHVLKNFDPSELTGFWYEQAFNDIAQAGASCPTLNSTLNAATSVVTMDLKVRYPLKIPFTITEIYHPEAKPGLYNKNAAMPGGSLLNLATVVADVKPSYMVLFSCIDVAVAHVTEVVIATKSRKVSEADYAAILATAHSLGVPFEDKKLNRVDWDTCH